MKPLRIPSPKSTFSLTKGDGIAALNRNAATSKKQFEELRDENENFRRELKRDLDIIEAFEKELGKKEHETPYEAIRRVLAELAMLRAREDTVMHLAEHINIRFSEAEIETSLGKEAVIKIMERRAKIDAETTQGGKVR